MPDRVQIEAPLDGAFGPVVRLIVGGIAERADLGFEEMDDLQLGIERLLAEAGAEGRVRLSFELGAGRDPHPHRPAARARRSPRRSSARTRPGELTLRRVLDTVVDSYGVEESTDGEIVVRLEKLADRGR